MRVRAALARPDSGGGWGGGGETRRTRPRPRAETDAQTRRRTTARMEDEEQQRREEMHAQLLCMGMCQELSDEAALKIGVGSIEIAAMFCIEASTRERVRSEAQKVEHKTGLRSQGAKAASLRGLSASPPADLLGNAAMGPKSSMALVVASITAEPDSDAEETADEETAPLSARVEAARNSKQLRPSQAVPAVGKRGAVEDEERRLDGALTMHTLHT